MSADPLSTFAVRQGLRTAILVSSIVAIVFGLVMLIWPVKSAYAVTIVIGIYAIIAGLLQLASGITAKTLSTWPRIGLIVLGLLFLVSGIVALANLAESTAVLAVIVTTFIGISWIFEGIVSLTSLGLKAPAVPGSDRAHEGWTIFFAIVSILAGVFVLISPLMTAVWLWIFLGASLLVTGFIGVFRASSLDH
ncbi:hypothetical protein GCM10010922_11600 [Microbacterium sorbitolivorans]|uniref:HdeD family acid-resistance protein n=1 Tax=Microbacterium sorbitolivorans TaxID=1867410 RepID=A0A367XYY6_9MICO|nr:DUF308 domain-containing protein [Microbacterium sorbitolivorans]RCK58619.1 hypothetical protein DTO57_10715 [Microbacterium sorbitolivorans]GGF37977.1 hypothetical protein GCM10010922_11600 [Microbacterium sorbitolivorans]